MAKVALWYRPVGLVSGMVGGAVAGAIFRRTWGSISGYPDAPDAVDERRTWTEVLLAAMIQGAVFAVVKAAVDRGSASLTRGVTGKWPAKT